MAGSRANASRMRIGQKGHGSHRARAQQRISRLMSVSPASETEAEAALRELNFWQQVRGPKRSRRKT